MALFCHSCKAKTKTVEPIMIKRFNYSSFSVWGLCDACMYTKHKFLSNQEVRQLDSLFFTLPIPATYLKVMKANGQTVELLPLLESIIN